MQRSAIAPARTQRPRSVAVRAQAVEQNGPWKKAASVLLASGLALSVAVQGAAAAPIRLEAKRVEQEEMLQQQLSKIEYLIQQQDNARKAELQGSRQALESQVNQAEVAIQRKLVEEAANQTAAAAKGEAERAARIAAEAQQIKAQEVALKAAAAKAEGQLQRAELVEKAKEAGEQQQVAKAAGSFMDLLGLTEADLGLSK
ncbi:hypothetical protein OEZ85_009704 [Tetradesmus obliquus]|uniref:ATPase family AAA domain-containing protein n=1 Tax=Tetradesmus obliquus TaxID=3088 RepID=A0ABY8UA24_TETOB|nr:hypothetical protein OEZ85_009704 [Tetradesmus obliquus]